MTEFPQTHPLLKIQEEFLTRPICVFSPQDQGLSLLNISSVQVQGLHFHADVMSKSLSIGTPSPHFPFLAIVFELAFKIQIPSLKYSSS
jgi:hypothetical protein